MSAMLEQKEIALASTELMSSGCGGAIPKAAGIMNQAANAVRDSGVAEERAAFHILQGLQRQLHS
jgi:hypothetical protein